MARRNPISKASFEEYLALEATASVRHEFVEGYRFEMAGGSDYHGIIANNINVRAYLAAENTDCTVFMENMIVRTPSGKGYYPDVFVTCEEANDGSRFKQRPCWVVEVLSETTEAVDRGEKLQNYTAIPSLQSYVLVSQDKPLVEMFERLADGSWRYTNLGPDAVLSLPCLELKLTAAQIYQGVKF